MDKEEKEEKILGNRIATDIFSREYTVNTNVSDTYKRSNYEDIVKMKAAKDKAYMTKDGKAAKTFIDPITGNQIHRDREAAGRKYGENKKTNHTSQT